jgi:hypothetical protein
MGSDARGVKVREVMPKWRRMGGRESSMAPPRWEEDWRKWISLMAKTEEMEKNGRGRKLDGATEAGKRPVEMDLTDGRNRGTERGSSSL